MPDVRIEIVDTSNSLLIQEPATTIEVGTSGPQGPVAGDSRSLAYVFTQSVASAIWNINHGLTFIPNITVVDSAGSVVEGDYSYPDENTVIATFSGAFAGKAYLS
jgi:hypothetical protein